MPKFIVTETMPCIQIWTYHVEAANEEEATQLVVDGKVEVVDSFVEEHNYEDATYEVEEDNSDNYEYGGEGNNDDEDDITQLEIPWDTQTI